MSHSRDHCHLDGLRLSTGVFQFCVTVFGVRRLLGTIIGRYYKRYTNKINILCGSDRVKLNR